MMVKQINIRAFIIIIIIIMTNIIARWNWYLKYRESTKYKSIEKPHSGIECNLFMRIRF